MTAQLFNIQDEPTQSVFMTLLFLIFEMTSNIIWRTSNLKQPQPSLIIPLDIT